MTLLADISDLPLTTAGWNMVVPNKALSVLKRTEANTMTQAFEKIKGFTAVFIGNKMGGRAQIHLPSPGYGQTSMS